MQFGIGQPVKRREDVRLVTGRGAFVDDLAGPGTLFAHVVRSDVAHGRIRGIDADAARSAPGVRAVLTGAELAEGGLGGIACHTLLPGLHRAAASRPVPALAGDRVLYVGMPLALVIAENRNTARDAAELVSADIEELPAVTTPAAAIAEGAPRLWDHAPGNLAFEIDLGDAAATEHALQAAAHVTRLRLHNNRLSANALETRAVLAEHTPRDGRLVVHASTQAPHALRSDLATILGLPQTAVRVIARDVGGGFGMKGGIHPEDVLVAWAAHRLRARVAWQATRTESLLSDYHGRDQWMDAALGLDQSGRICALKVECEANAGAFLSPGGGVPPLFAAALATGCYRVPAAHVHARAVFTNTSPTAPYRGAGRPEAAFLVERLMDAAARETGRDRIALRRLNMVTAGEMPYQTPLLYRIDSGDYGAVLERALDLFGWRDAEARKLRARARGRLRGIGVALHMEHSGLANETAELRFEPDGTLTALVGTFSHGQGHETVFAQMLSDWLGLPYDRIRVEQGDTDKVSFGRGTVASRSMINGGGSLKLASERVIEKGRAIAAALFEAAADDVIFADGAFSLPGTNRRMEIARVAEAGRSGRTCPPDWGSPVGHRSLQARGLYLSLRCPGGRGRGRSRNRCGGGHGHPLGGRCRPGHQPHAAGGPDRRWRRPGAGPGADGERGL